MQPKPNVNLEHNSADAIPTRTSQPPTTTAYNEKNSKHTEKIPLSDKLFLALLIIGIFHGLIKAIILTLES